MNRKLRARLTIFAFIILGLMIGGWAAFDTHTIEKDSAYLQAMIDKHLPKSKFGATVEKVTIKLADSKANITADISGKIARHFDLSIAGTGVPDYRRARHGDVYITADDLQITHFSYDKKPPGRIASALRRTEAGAQILDGIHDKIEDEVAVLARKAALWWMDNYPVYRLKEDTAAGWVVYATVHDRGVHIVGDKLVVEYSVWRLSLIVVVTVVLVVIAVILMFAAPEAILILAPWV